MHFLFLSGLFLSIMFPLFCLPSWYCVCVCRTTRSWSCSGWFITVECSTKSERRCGLSFWDTTSLAWAKRRWVRYSARAHTHTHTFFEFALKLVKPCVKIDAKIGERYQQVMREWKACEVIVKQREKEMQSAIFAKLSSGSSIDSHVLRLVHRDSTLSNEVTGSEQYSIHSVIHFIKLGGESLLNVIINLNIRCMRWASYKQYPKSLLGCLGELYIILRTSFGISSMQTLHRELCYYLLYFHFSLCCFALRRQTKTSTDEAIKHVSGWIIDSARLSVSA